MADQNEGVTRRDILKLSGLAAGTSVLGSVPAIGLTQEGTQNSETAAKVPPYKAPFSDEPQPVGDDFLNRYRKHWTWDYTQRSTHFNNCAYQAHCAFEVYVRDGKVIREEQAATYTTARPGLPDANPRGCQKGCGYSSLMQGKVRLTRPLKRKGERGSGEWEEMSWEQAIGEIADKVVDVLATSGPNSIVMDVGTNALAVTAFGSAMQFADATDCVVLDINTELGDDMQGAAVTYGSIFQARSADEFFHSDLVLCWSGNPAFTQIPNFHFLTEARYRGTKFVVIAPDYNATAMHADLWVPVRAGTDAALALAMAKVIIDERLHNEALLREQTDLPVLVRQDNGRYLRESDLKRGGSQEQLYCWDEIRTRLQEVSTATLELGSVRPALEGSFEVRTLNGPVQVQPAFECLKSHIASYTPEAASAICGTPPAIIRQLARMMGKARAACNVETLALGKFHHGDAMMRAQILVFVLCGHLGRKGAGWTAMADAAPDALGTAFGSRRGRKATAKLGMRQWYELLRDNFKGLPPSRLVKRGLSEGWVQAKAAANGTLFWNYHAGVLDVSAQAWDPTLPRPPRAYLDEALAKGWQALEPPQGHTPKVFFQVAGNVLRRVRAAHKLREVLWPKLDLVVVTDLRMSTTARQADYFLPVAGFYEKPNTGYYTGSMLNACATNAVVPPLDESKDEWEIYWLLSNEIQKRAQARGIATFQDRHDEPRRFDEFLDTYTLGGALGRKDVARLCKRFIEQSTNLGGVSWEEISQRGYAPVTSLGTAPNNGGATDWKPQETVTPFLWHTRDKKPWPTFSGRVQFYIDHPWYLELGEQLPAFKEPPKAGGDYPMTLNGGHTRWSIHSLQRSDPLMLRLQRGQPCLYMSVQDAQARDIKDWDRVEVFNDLGRFRVRVKISPAIRPGLLMHYHAWEDYQYEGGVGPHDLVASPINPLELAGDYPYLDTTMYMRQPGMSDRDTRVDVRRL